VSLPDIEVAHDVEPTSQSRRLGLLVGIAAILGASLGVLQMDASTREAQASARTSRLSVQLSRDLTINGLYSGFLLPTQKDVFAEGIESTARALAALEAGIGDAVAIAASDAESAATERILPVVEEMGSPPESGLDRRTLEAVRMSIEDIGATLEEQNRQADLVTRMGRRGDRSVFALSLAAVAAVLLGLAGIVGASRAGRVITWSAAGALVLAAGTGVTALLI
jgi:hypothetical protein